MSQRDRSWPGPMVPVAAMVLFAAVVTIFVAQFGRGFPVIPLLPITVMACAMALSSHAAGVHRRSELRASQPIADVRAGEEWAQARQRFHAVRAEYAAFECDPTQVLRLPALADVSVPSTGRFVDAFAEAQALDTDAEPPARHRESFVAAVDKAERAWHAARDAAERIRLSNLSPAERSTVERVLKLLTTARDSDNDAERLVAYARARSELTKLSRAGAIHVPAAAQAALDTAWRGALPA